MPGPCARHLPGQAARLGGQLACALVVGTRLVGPHLLQARQLLGHGHIAPALAEQLQELLVLHIGFAHQRRVGDVARLRQQLLPLGIGLGLQGLVRLLDGARGGLQLLEAEGHHLVEQADHHGIARLGQVGVELHLGALRHLLRHGVAGRRLELAVGQDGQAADLGVEQQLLARHRHGEGHELARLIGILGARDQRDVGRHHGRHRRVGEVHRKARVLARQPEEIDHDAYAVLAVVHAIGHGKAAVGHGGGIAHHGQQLAPALVPALALQDSLHRQLRGARARGRGDGDVAEVLGPRQIAPLLGRRQLVRLQVARVPHDSVAGQRLAVVQALRVVERVVADLGGRGRIARLGRSGQQLVARQHLEGIRGAGPHDVGPLALGQLAHIGHGGRGVLVQDLYLDPRIGRLEGLLVGRGQLLGKRGQHRHRAGLGRHGGAPQSCGHGGRQPSALLHCCLLRVVVRSICNPL